MRARGRTAEEQRHDQRVRLARVVVNHPTHARRPSCKTLKSAIEHGERAMLVVLRRMLAAEIDKGQLAGAALAAVTKQFREINAEIRSIDLAEAEAAVLAAGDDAVDVGDDDAGWDPNNI